MKTVEQSPVTPDLEGDDAQYALFDIPEQETNQGASPEPILEGDQYVLFSEPMHELEQTPLTIPENINNTEISRTKHNSKFGSFIVKRFMAESGTERRLRHRRDADEDYQKIQANLDTERPLDNLVTHDKEILGESAKKIFFMAYRNRADLLVKRVERAEKRVDKAGVRERYSQYRKNATDLKIARLKQKLEGSSGKSSLIAHHIRQRRRWKLQNLQHRNNKFSGRVEKLEKARNDKPENLRKKIDDLVAKKVRSEQKKAQNRAIRKKHDIKFTRLHPAKRAEFLTKLTPETKRKIVREAILQVRRDNIRKGRLDPTAELFGEYNVRKVTDEYGRSTK